MMSAFASLRTRIKRRCRLDYILAATIPKSLVYSSMNQCVF